jgi:hypothetical protein
MQLMGFILRRQNKQTLATLFLVFFLSYPQDGPSDDLFRSEESVHKEALDYLASPEYKELEKNIDGVKLYNYYFKDEWKAQTCTGGCSGMDYGPFKDLLDCVERMTKLGVRFTCGSNCSTDYLGNLSCKKVMRYRVIERNGRFQPVPIQ